jgi:hypothetical protein
LWAKGLANPQQLVTYNYSEQKTKLTFKMMTGNLFQIVIFGFLLNPLAFILSNFKGQNNILQNLGLTLIGIYQSLLLTVCVLRYKYI